MTDPIFTAKQCLSSARGMGYENAGVPVDVLEALIEAFQRARRGLKEITAFADPEEILAEPEEFGGTDDGKETVCMAYENMQFTAANCLRHVDEALGYPHP